VPEGPARVPIDTLRADQRDRLRVLAAGAGLELRWDGDDAVLVAPADEAQARLLVAAAAGVATTAPTSGSAPTSARTAPTTPAATATSASGTTGAMWAIDPTGRHEYRYWSGTTWTAHVADRGLQGADPLAEAPTARPIVPPPGADAASRPMVSTVGPVGRSPVPSDPTRVLGRRYGAFFIDLTITFAVFAIVFFPLATRRSVADTLRLPGCSRSSLDSSRVECDNRVIIQLDDHTVYEADVLPTAGLTLLFIFLYFGIFEGLTGATLGKRAAGIRVVQPDGSTVGVSRSLVRWVLFAVDGPLSLFLCGIITSATSRGHRRLGDMGAQTFVVSRHAAGHPIDIP
jgi:uncharacterized RDD family membrane protein YckC